mgnify:CR=1 FL=1
MREKAAAVGIEYFTYVQEDGRACDAPDVARNMQEILKVVNELKNKGIRKSVLFSNWFLA